MGPVLTSLVNLQATEHELRLVKGKLKKAQQLVLAQEHKIKQLQAGLEAKREEIKLTRVQYGKLELDLKSRDTEVSKLRLALNTAKTNKDYSAILTRLNTEKADKSKLEDQALGLLSQVETDQSACREIEENISQEEQRLVEVKEKTAERRKAYEAEIERLVQQRQEECSQVPAKERSLFERLAEHHSGDVIAEIAQPGNRRRDQSCGGCYMAIPLELVNSLMTRDEVVTCPSCGRILVLDQTATQQPTS